MKPIVLLITLLAFSGVAFAQKTETMTIKVYFHPDKLDPDVMDCQKVAPVKRTIPKTAAVAKASLEELFKGPTAAEAKEYSGFGPPETNGILKSVKVKSGAAYVNFTKRVYEQMGSATSSCGGGFFSNNFRRSRRSIMRSKATPTNSTDGFRLATARIARRSAQRVTSNPLQELLWSNFVMV